MEHDNLETAAGVREGEILDGKYRVEKVLGAGGMGIVVAARHLQLDKRVALKFLHRGMVKNEEAVSRFAREARAAVKITGEHVARVLDVGTLTNCGPYLVMEFLEGIDLGAWIRQSGPLPIEQAIDFVLQACVAIAEAHSLGIVHRDLKPANLFCVRRADGQLSIKVLDFGISKVISAGASLGPSRAETRTGALMGSPFYMSPEQMTSARDVDARTDIWALGIILQELISGITPFHGDTLPEICIKVATSRPTPLRQVRPDAPAGLEAVVMRCLEKDRGARYRNVGELALALCAFGPARGHALVDAILGILQPAGQTVGASFSNVATRGDIRTFAEASLPTLGRTEAGTEKRKAWGWLGAGVAAIVVTAAAGLALFRSDARLPRPQPAPAAAAAPANTSPREALTAEPGDSRLAPAPTPAAAEDLGLPPRPSDDDPLPSHASPHAAATAPTPPPTRRYSAHPATSAAPTAGSNGPAALAPPAHSSTAVNCDPPFFFDSQGNRVFKRECVN